MNSSWILGSVQPEATDEERAYCDALRELAQPVGGSLREVAERIFLSPSQLSRMLNARRRVQWHCAERIHILASQASDLELLPVEKLRELHDRAGASRGDQSCDRSSGSALPPAGHGNGTDSHLPVPRLPGDRQVLRNGSPPAEDLVAQAVTLYEQDMHDGALAVLQDSVSALTALEGALAVVLLRQGQHDDLAGTFVQIYGRDQSDQDVMQLAAELLQHHSLADDAGALLRSALRTRAGKDRG